MPHSYWVDWLIMDSVILSTFAFSFFIPSVSNFSL
uniref:Uncharacterized protein n=1 Tax=Rhizophora mucronata TaxID=61149 RepID=A0A2P2PT19_RHIMU